MDIASFRLKFTPMVKGILHNNANCCLEIVPQISCVQNIDKIKWKQNCDYLEYTIPITYKIILKKKESETVDTIDWHKSYHSCVELYPPLSLTSMNNAYGDVKRIISDSFILSSVTSHYEEDAERIINIHAPKSKEINDQVEIIIANREKEVSRLRVDTVVPNAIDKVLLDNIEESLEESNADSTNDQFLNNDTTHEAPPEYDIDKKPSYKDIAIKITESLHNNRYESLENLNSKENSRRHLSVTPVCSLNTYDNSFADTTVDVFSLNSVIRRMFGSENVHSSMYFVPKQEYVVKDQILAYNQLALDGVESVNDISVSPSFNTTYREGPETRVAEFMKKMEAEILPLKIMLNNILTKCATLGVLQNKSITSFEFDQANTNRVVEKQSKSNRVVYTVVFDG